MLSMFGPVVCSHHPDLPDCAWFLSGPPWWSFLIMPIVGMIVIILALINHRKEKHKAACQLLLALPNTEGTGTCAAFSVECQLQQTVNAPKGVKNAGHHNR